MQQSEKALIVVVTVIMLTSLIFIFSGTLSVCVMITDVTEGYHACFVCECVVDVQMQDGGCNLCEVLVRNMSGRCGTFLQFKACDKFCWVQYSEGLMSSTGPGLCT